MRWRWNLCAALVLSCVAVCAASGQATAAASEPKAHDQQALPLEVRQALTLEKQGKIAEAAIAWQRVVKADPKNAQAFAQLGVLEARLERYGAAIAAYRAARRLQPGMAGLELNYALALFKAEEYKQAAAVTEAELKRHPEGPETLRLTTLAGMACYGARDYKTAAAYLKTAAESDRRNLPLLLVLGHCYLWAKQLDETLAVYRRILEIDPDSAEADMIAGEALDEKGDNAGAVAQFQAAVKANPKEPQAHFGLAYLFWTQKRYEEAVAEFHAELENDPRNSLAMIYLADTYVRQSQYEQARPVLEEALKLKPEVPLVHLNLGIVLMETDHKDAATAELQKAIALEPDNVAAHFRLAELYRGEGKKDEAKVEFAKSKALTQKTDKSLFQRISEASAKGPPAGKSASPEQRGDAAPSEKKGEAEPPAAEPNR